MGKKKEKDASGVDAPWPQHYADLHWQHIAWPGDPAPGTTIGDRCDIHSTVMIGSPAFCYTRSPGVVPTRKPQFGGVCIGDDVSIHALTNVDRGTERDTVIMSGAKIDHHVHVGHDCQLGERCIVCAGTILDGHVTLGTEVYLGIGVRVTPRVTIGAGAHVGANTLVRRDIPPGRDWRFQDPSDPGKVKKGRAV